MASVTARNKSSEKQHGGVAYSVKISSSSHERGIRKHNAGNMWHGKRSVKRMAKTSRAYQQQSARVTRANNNHARQTSISWLSITRSCASACSCLQHLRMARSGHTRHSREKAARYALSASAHVATCRAICQQRAAGSSISGAIVWQA